MGKMTFVTPDSEAALLAPAAPRLIFSGKGGAGKTTVMSAFTYLFLEEVKEPMRVLFVDADPAMTTQAVSRLFADILEKREKPLLTIGDLADKLTEKEYLEARKENPSLTKEVFVLSQVIDKAIGVTKYKNAYGVEHDVMFMRIGQHHNNHCMCSFNNALNTALNFIMTAYDKFKIDALIMDREAGQEHINRSVYPRVTDTVVAVAHPSISYLSVANDVISTHVEVQKNKWGEARAKDRLVINTPYPVTDEQIAMAKNVIQERFTYLAQIPMTVFPFIPSVPGAFRPLDKKELLTDEVRKALFPMLSDFLTSIKDVKNGKVAQPEK